MKNKKILMFIIIFAICLVYSYIVLYADHLKINNTINYLVLIITIVTGLYAINLIKGNEKNKNNKFREKLFSSLISNSNTVYIMMNSNTNEVLYVSGDIEEIIGVTVKERSMDEVVSRIFSIPIIKEELKNWDKKSEYISQMIEYDNPKYNHQMWIRLKIYLFKEKKSSYYVMQIINATKEHERQHLLVTQASDIKAKESQLNQIVSSSYDMEININLNTNIYDLKYFKKDNLYFGEERRGTYSAGLLEIANNFINENDRDNFIKTLGIENLKLHFSRFELDSYTLRYRIGNKVKNNIWLESTIFFLSNRQNNKVSILTKNVTENAESIRKQNVLLQNALNDAKMVSKSKTELISTISHDVRTPLSSIMGLSESLLNKNIDNAIKDDVKDIYSSSREAIEIVDGLLDASKIEKRIIEKEEKEYNVLKIFKRLEETAKDYAKDKSIEINLNLNSNLPVILYGDSNRIFQAVSQIINNSIKYTEEGTININVRGEKKNNQVNLIVEIGDTGVGIDQAKLGKIMNSNDGTTGIGAVKNLMKILGGSFEIESKVNEYTKVTLSFAQKIVEDNKIRELMDSNKKAQNLVFDNKKILIVDDNKLNLKVTSKLLEPYHIETTLLESGEECIDIIKEGVKFDLILLDQMMPGLNGTETLKRLKELDGFNIPVVVLTADAIQGQREKYLSDGFNDYISKPIDKNELNRVLKKYLGD